MLHARCFLRECPTDDGGSWQGGFRSTDGRPAQGPPGPNSKLRCGERQQRGATAIAASTWSASRWPVPWRNREKLAERTARAEAARWSGLRLRLVHRRQVHRGVSGPSSCRRPRRCSGRRGGPPKLRPLRVTVSPSVGDDGQGRPRRPEALEGRPQPGATTYCRPAPHTPAGAEIEDNSRWSSVRAEEVRRSVGASQGAGVGNGRPLRASRRRETPACANIHTSIPRRQAAGQTPQPTPKCLPLPKPARRCPSG